MTCIVSEYCCGMHVQHTLSIVYIRSTCNVHEHTVLVLTHMQYDCIYII